LESSAPYVKGWKTRCK